jgi:hypothetical protein
MQVSFLLSLSLQLLYKQFSLLCQIHNIIFELISLYLSLFHPFFSLFLHLNSLKVKLLSFLEFLSKWLFYSFMLNLHILHSFHSYLKSVNFLFLLREQDIKIVDFLSFIWERVLHLNFQFLSKRCLLFHFLFQIIIFIEQSLNHPFQLKTSTKSSTFISIWVHSLIRPSPNPNSLTVVQYLWRGCLSLSHIFLCKFAL